MFGKILLLMNRFCLHVICCWEAIANEPYPSGTNRMMERLCQSQYWKTLLSSLEDLRNSSSFTARFAYPFILPHCHLLICFFFPCPAVVLLRVTFFFYLHFHLHCTFNCPVLHFPPCLWIHIVIITHDVMLESAGSSDILEHFYLTTYCQILEAVVCKKYELGINSTSMAFIWKVMKIDDLGQKLKKKCYQIFILSLIPFVIYVQSHAASDFSSFSNRMPSPLQPGQSCICCIKFILESFINEETKVPISFREVSPPDISLSGPQKQECCT